MALTNIGEADYTNMSETVEDYQVKEEDTDINDYVCEWSKWYGYYRAISAYSSMIDRKALWVIGKGYKADPNTTKILDGIRGFGKDTFNTILHNGVKVYSLGGDFLAEKVLNKRGKLINLKPLNPGRYKILANKKGILTGYQALSGSVKGSAASEKVIPPDKIFHLAWNRSADDIHGTGTTEKIEAVLKMYQEAAEDLKVVFHRYVKPIWVFAVDTDDSAQIAAFKTKVDEMVNKAENLVIPKDTVDKFERLSIPQYSTLDPLPWLRYLEQEFFKAEGVPAVVQGVATEATEAESKMLYLAWQQVVEWNQLFLEQQIKAQLGMDVQFEFPADIAPELEEDQAKRRKINDKSRSNKAGQQE